MTSIRPVPTDKEPPRWPSRRSGAKAPQRPVRARGLRAAVHALVAAIRSDLAAARRAGRPARPVRRPTAAAAATSAPPPPRRPPPPRPPPPRGGRPPFPAGAALLEVLDGFAIPARRWHAVDLLLLGAEPFRRAADADEV